MKKEIRPHLEGIATPIVSHSSPPNEGNQTSFRRDCDYPSKTCHTSTRHEGNQTSFRRDCDTVICERLTSNLPEGNQTSFRRDCDVRHSVVISMSV